MLHTESGYLENCLAKGQHCTKPWLTAATSGMQSCHYQLVLKAFESLWALFKWLPLIKKDQLDESFQVNCMTTFYSSTIS